MGGGDGLGLLADGQGGWAGNDVYVAAGRELERAFLSRSGSSLVADGLGPEVSVGWDAGGLEQVGLKGKITQGLHESQADHAHPRSPPVRQGDPREWNDGSSAAAANQAASQRPKREREQFRSAPGGFPRSRRLTVDRGAEHG